MGKALGPARGQTDIGGAQYHTLKYSAILVLAAGTPAEFIRDACGFVGWRDAKRTPSKLSLASGAVVNWCIFRGCWVSKVPEIPCPNLILPSDTTCGILGLFGGDSGNFEQRPDLR